MALFAKKDKDAAPAKAAKPAKSGGDKKGMSFGRKKTAPEPAAAPAPDAAGGFEDFSDFSEEALNGPTAAPAPAAPSKAVSVKPPRKTKKGLKGGAVVGLNIGNDSIKAVEIKGKGENIAVTAMGMIPTPPESISNGVVMSTTALAHAIRDLFQKSGIKTKRVITSVSGTGALVVRVIEVPKMSDNELKDNMAVDVDRYIPFPPSEVILDFKALRELPTDADNPNMEVLLAAAQREIVDLHVNVLLSAKLDPQAIDVEPLAAARSLAYDALSDSNNGRVGDGHQADYADVSALINIGATNTEISVLRGDVLVFTRSIPRGGNALTEALATELDLNPFDAERLKRETGDALPPHGTPVQSTAQVAPDMAPLSTAPPSEDFAGFDAAFGDTTLGDEAGSMVAPDAIAPDTIAPGTAAGADEWNSFDNFGEATSEVGMVANAPVPTPGAVTQAPATNSDPFDLDFFNQGPQNDEPQEQHQQKQDDEPFDFSDFTIEEARAAADNLPEPAGDADDEFSSYPSMQERMARQQSDANTGNWDSAVHPDEAAPSGQMFHFDAIDDPSLPSFPALPTHLIHYGIEADDFASLPTIVDDTDEATDESYNLPAEAEADVLAPVGETAPASPVAAEAPAAPSSFGFAFDEHAEAAGTAGQTTSPDPMTTDLAASLSNDALAEFAGIPMPDSEINAPVTSTPASAAPLETAPGLATGVAESAGAVSTGAVSSAFDFNTLETPIQAAVPAPIAPPVQTPAIENDDDSFDIDSLLGPDVQPAAQAATAQNVAPSVLDDISAFDDTSFGGAAPGADFAADFGDLQDFGAGLTGDSATAGISAARVHDVMAPLLDELVGEVRRSLEYFASRYPDSGVRRITLVGGGARLTNIDAYFTQSLGIPTICGNAFAGVAVRAPQLPSQYIDETGPIYAVALGLALRDLV